VLADRTTAIRTRSGQQPVRTKHHPARTTLALLGAVVLVAALANSLATEASANPGSHDRPGQSVQIVRITDHGFSWGDAGIGAAAGIGISMLAVGAVLAVSRGDRRVAASTPPERLANAVGTRKE
jgi:hypothetical protein